MNRDWIYEIIDSNTNKVLFTDKGFDSELEAEYFARLEIKKNKLDNFIIRTFSVISYYE